MVEHLQARYEVSQRRACRVAQIARSRYRCRPSQADGIERINVVTELSYRYPRFGYRKIHTLTQHAGQAISREHVCLIRKRAGLQVMKKQKNMYGVMTLCMIKQKTVAG